MSLKHFHTRNITIIIVMNLFTFDFFLSKLNFPRNVKTSMDRMYIIPFLNTKENISAAENNIQDL